MTTAPSVQNERMSSASCPSTAAAAHPASRRSSQEWRPRGASEFILIGQMTQSYVVQLYWTEEAMRRAQTEPRLESCDYRECKEQRKAQAKANQWEARHWDIPYQYQADAVEQAFRLVDLCSKSFQRAARQLANIPLVRAKTARMRRRERAKLVKGIRVAQGRIWTRPRFTRRLKAERLR